MIRRMNFYMIFINHLSDLSPGLAQGLGEGKERWYLVPCKRQQTKKSLNHQL